MAAKHLCSLQQHTAKKNNGRDLSDASFTVILRLARFCFFNPHVPDSLGLFDMLTKFSAVTTTNLPPRSDESKQERGWGWRGCYFSGIVICFTLKPKLHFPVKKSYK